MDILSNNIWNEISIDKFFIIEKNEKSNISGNIEIKQDINNGKKYTFYVKNPKTAKWNWWIKKFIWEIDWKRTVLKSDYENQEESSKITHFFKGYWKKIIKVTLIDDDNLEQTFTKTILLKEKPQLKSWLIIYNEEWKIIKNVKYEKNINTYNIKKFEVPSQITIDARSVENKNPLYELEKVEFDLDGDWLFDKIWEKKVNVELATEKNYKIKVKYIFKHSRDYSKKRELIENIRINAEKKEAHIKVDIDQLDQYAPTDVTFDASESWVKWKTKDDYEDIVEFAYDYWDWTPIDKTDAKTTHRYIKDWHYNVKLTITTKNWKQYVKDDMEIILKPEVCKAVISTSMYRNIPVWQDIDFSSEKSTCLIESWFWNFWDWTKSTEANPEHFYKKPWKYKVKLVLILKNRNKVETEKEITVIR
jgi:hypothetical protein